ncbi:polyprenyl synthetase family protein [Actinomyces radicidentis]|uniref:polyprenyl synthetase family protein n=1 Tax=Actinomyces radicidentis TaxID=111015 RepID=UPI0026E0112B|nr:polyprenyl synthetase family protein [Actinomyces radicidentis]
MSDLPRTMTLVRTAVSARLEEVLAERRTALAGVDGAADLLDAATALLAGGKRMRAVLAAAGLALGVEDPAERETVLMSPAAARLGAALELYQASALAHDDVIDAAETRRGLPAAHRALAALHAERSWRGSPHDFGASAAILLGDLLLSAAGGEAGAAVAASDAGPGARLAARDAFDAMTEEVAVGQFLDLRGEALPLSAPGEDAAAAAALMREQALAVVLRKSARYSVARPLLLGAALAGLAPDSAEHAALAHFGEETGAAFQLRDDVLGVVGDPAETGKPVGDDLREGKRTVLLAVVWGRTDEAGRALLREVLAHRDASPERVAEAVGLVRACGALEEHEREIATHVAGARAALDELERLASRGAAPGAAALRPSRATLGLLGDLAEALTARSA